MIKVFVADDHQLVIDGIKLMLSTEEDMTFVGQAINGQETLEQLEKTDADILLLDIDMPILNGIEVCKRLQKANHKIKILALSMLQEVSLIKMIIKHSAKGFLLKNAGKDEVVQAIREVYKGNTFYSADVSDLIMGSLSGKAASKKSNHPFPKLSRREKQVLQLIVDEFTTAEIAEKLFISFGTVETHRRNLLMKLDARNVAGLVRICLEYDLLKES